MSAELPAGTHDCAFDLIGFTARRNWPTTIGDGAQTTSTYDAANQLETAEDATGTTNFTFDADGNEQVVIAPNGNRTTTTWNFENQPTLTVKPNASRITTTYNADNRRVEKEA